MDTMNERVKLAIRTSGLSASEVGRRLGVSPEAVLQWMNGPTKNLRMKYLFGLAKLTGYEAEWLGTGEGPQRQLKGDPREEAIVTLYRHCDERGKAAVFRVAEAESTYGAEQNGNRPAPSIAC